jgi:hypothetical protein
LSSVTAPPASAVHIIAESTRDWGAARVPMHNGRLVDPV